MVKSILIANALVANTVNPVPVYNVADFDYKTFSIQSKAAGTSLVVVVEGSNDGVNWFTISTINNPTNGGVTIPANIVAFCFIRARVTNYVSGTATIAVSAQKLESN